VPAQRRAAVSDGGQLERKGIHGSQYTPRGPMCQSDGLRSGSAIAHL